MKDEDREIVRETVRETLTALGMDAADPLAVQQDLAWVRQARIGSQQVKKVARRTVVAGGITGGAYLIWQGLKVIGVIQ